MDAFYEWLWRRFGDRYLWVVTLGTTLPSLAVVYAFVGWAVLRIEESDRFTAMILFGVAAAIVMSVSSFARVDVSDVRRLHRWGAGERDDPDLVLMATYRCARSLKATGSLTLPLTAVAVWVAAGLLSGASMGRVAAYAANGFVFGLTLAMISVHGVLESCMRPVRVELARVTDIGDALPRARPTVAQWSNIGLLGTMLAFVISGLAFGASVDIRDKPILILVIGLTFTVIMGVPVTLTQSMAPMLRPLADLADATKRVTGGDFGQRVPVVQDDDLGVLAASFNRMQLGLAERERLHSAFGSYVDPALAERLLAQGDDLFSGERVEVTVMFVDIRDFTPFAEANTAEDTVSRLNALFETVIDAVDAAGGHVNKFLGDGAMVVFGAPERLGDHADRALTCARRIQDEVARRFHGEVRIGIGINSGTVIAGTIGSARKREFTLIGDAVNVAARVEQLTKTTGDTILVTEAVLDAATTTPDDLVERGAHELKGKTRPVTVYALSPREPTTA